MDERGSGHSHAREARRRKRSFDISGNAHASPEPIIPGAQYAQTQIAIQPSALTGLSTIDDTTKKLTATLAKVMDIIEYVPGLTPQAYGTLVHTTFANAIRLQDFPGIGFWDVETTFGGDRYGAKGSIRTDVVLRDEIGDIIAIYDVKTGEKGLSPARAAELRTKTGASQNVPIIEMSISRGVLRKGIVLRAGRLRTRATAFI